ncbi:uncharacterized protein [Euwallacea fornicatus]|uniref:uncharacterized protein isoform X2 n=1 Tax=Euwallacea fornicatus TaxID=995702 RepID=UPI00339022C0
MIPFFVKCDFVKHICVVTERTTKYKMPSEGMTLVTTGIGVSVLAGILSGVCYVLAHGLGIRRRSDKKKFDWYCEICDTYLHSSINILNDDLVRCSKCDAKVCTEKCSKFINHSTWICKKCLKPSGLWFQEISDAIRFNSREGDAMMDQDPRSNSDLDTLQRLEREHVRDFIEKLVTVLLGENVDNASVSMLYTDRHYLPVVGQSPCTAHAALKQLIEKLLREAVNLPLLQQARLHPTNLSEESTNGSYEDLLATAIINKIVTNCQNNLPSSSANSVSSRLSSSSKQRDDKEYFFGKESLDSKWKTADPDTSSVSSLEEWLHNSPHPGSKKYVDKVTLMIKQGIEEVEDFDSENEDEEYLRSSSSLFNDSESNWFLQKRKFQGTNSPVPVPMLVPNPSDDAKVLIGDKPLDDTSDLSDVGSAYEEYIQPNTTHSLLVQSKNIIGGGKAPSFEPNENADGRSESSSDSGVKEVNGKEQKTFDAQEVRKTDISLDDDNVDYSSFLSASINMEKENEYTEKYASLPRQIEIKSSTPHKSDKKRLLQGEFNDSNSIEQENETAAEFIGGNYSKKEKEKWTHAIEMKHNPYTRESIDKRIKRSNSNTSLSSYGPDYYARLAGKPSGGGKQSTEVNGVVWPPPSQPQDSRSSGTPPEIPKLPPPSRFIEVEEISLPRVPTVVPPPRPSILSISSDPPPEPPKSLPPPRETNGIHQAVKAIVTPVDEEESSMSSTEAKTTSDSDLSYVNSYDVEHSQVVKTSKSGDVHIPIKATPLGLSYKSLSNGNDEQEVFEVAVPTPRTTATQSRNYSSLQMHRQGSESNLISDQPKVLHQRKDNTLISKIYKDPKVRLFSLQSREESPESIEEHISPTYYREKNLNKGHKSNSDDGLTSEAESGKTGKMSFFSSEEDLLSLQSDSSFRPIEVVSASNGEVKVNGVTRSPPLTPRAQYFKRMYSSHEDLLSIDENQSVTSIPPRKDNTIISKIYQDPNVRNFAFKTHGHFVPVEPDYHQNIHKHYTPKRYVDSSAEISLETSRQNSITPNYLHSDHLRTAANGSECSEIAEMANKHAVSEVLEKWHEEELNKNNSFQKTASIDDLDSIQISVRDLRKKFESSDVSNKPVVSSLTARSLSMQVREILKQ